MLKNIENIIYIKKEFPSIDEYLMLEIKDNENILKYINYTKIPEIKKVEDDIALEFVDCLLRIVDNWECEYENNDMVIDGANWKLQINYKNGYQKYYSGKNAFPINFDELDKIKYKLIEQLRG